MLGVHAVGAEFFNFFPVDESFNFVIVEHFYFLHFVGSAESVEEVTERHFGFNGGKVGYQGHVVGFLHGTAADEGKTRLAAGHDVLVVAEDGQGVGRQRAGRHVEHAGKQLARNLVHVGNHEQEPLRGRKGGGQNATGQGSVRRAGRAGFRLKLAHLHGLSKNVLPSIVFMFLAIKGSP